MPRIDRQRRDDRIESALEKLIEKSLLLSAHLLRPDQMYPFGCKLQQNTVKKTMVLFLREIMDSPRDCG